MTALRHRMDEQDYQSLVSVDPHSSLADTRTELRELRNQLSTIVNILISIFTAAMAAWFWTPHWRVGHRVLCALGSAIGLGAIEAFLYFRFLVKIEQGKEYDAKQTRGSTVKKSSSSRATLHGPGAQSLESATDKKNQ